MRATLVVKRFASSPWVSVTASIVRDDCGSDGTQSSEIRGSLLAQDPPFGFYLRSPQPRVLPIPSELVSRLPAEATAAADASSPESPYRRRTGVLHVRPPLVSRDLLRPFQHLVHFVEIDVAEQRRDG